ncbi:MAG TPA: Na+/H+ antiporter subunit C [Thermoanaerobaculia bacterium]|nr:Na+/H+ antiporter subunit C [Thermoanaerobaculia bacterium]
MVLVLAVVIGTLYATGLYMMLRRSIVKLIIGLALLSHASNLLIFVAAPAGGPIRSAPPIIPPGLTAPAGLYADPLPQALILTAIVIGFGVVAFALVLVRKAYQTLGTEDLDQMRSRER